MKICRREEKERRLDVKRGDVVKIPREGKHHYYIVGPVFEGRYTLVNLETGNHLHIPVTGDRWPDGAEVVTDKVCLKVDC